LGLTKYYSGNKIKKNEIGWAYSTYGGGGEVHTGFGRETLKEKGHLENLGIAMRIILKWI